jgi:riboflavin biosynthesis pyrimidine reductase
MEHNLVDELRLMIYPFVLGSGGRLFGETRDMSALRLLSTQTVGDGLVFVTYELVTPGGAARP